MTFEIQKEEVLAEIQDAVERMLISVVSSIEEIERLKRKEYLTPEEVQALYSLNPATMANERSKAKGPEYSKAGVKVLYSQQAIKKYLEKKTIKTHD